METIHFLMVGLFHFLSQLDIDTLFQIACYIARFIAWSIKRLLDKILAHKTETTTPNPQPEVEKKKARSRSRHNASRQKNRSRSSRSKSPKKCRNAVPDAQMRQKN